jgi:hypothetical protein
VPEADEKDGELNGNGMLWKVGVVVKNMMVLDEFHEAVKDRR